jgi:transposase
MHRYELTDEQWSRIADEFPGNGKRGGQWKDHRTVANGVLWVLCSGAAWRDLPERYGCFQTVHGRHLRWRRDGTWERVLAGLRARADAAGLIDWAQWNADATSVRATRHAAGARKKGGRNRASRRTTRWACPAAGSAASCTC